MTDDASIKPTRSIRAGRTGKESKGTDWWAEVKSITLLLLAVLGFHSFIAKPFYIPSESMMPGLLVGDRLVVSKYAYGWSYVSPTIPNPVAIFRNVVLRSPPEPWGITLPFMEGRIWGKMPERGDIVIATPRHSNEDYIKRVIGLPGDTLEVREGIVILNGTPVKQEWLTPLRLAVDANSPCDPRQLPGALQVEPDGSTVCVLPVKRETLPNGASYTIVDTGPREIDWYGPVRIPEGHVFLMGDNRDNSADSRVSLEQQGLGGPIPWETIGGRAEFITFSLDGTTTLNPATWFSSFRGGRAGTSLRPEHAETPAQ
ncbi:signal peptidase I [Sphingobium lignivorans]|uniref:Signal peptidase I n=1 Tax=Sphingobium lignivorans TaxID=2735886 RepID=A0ABR6NDT2_9SPHN|nr:signal peptidase I [Sphingobium lignivorans]